MPLPVSSEGAHSSDFYNSDIEAENVDDVSSFTWEGEQPAEYELNILLGLHTCLCPSCLKFTENDRIKYSSPMLTPAENMERWKAWKRVYTRRAEEQKRDAEERKKTLEYLRELRAMGVVKLALGLDETEIALWSAVRGM